MAARALGKQNSNLNVLDGGFHACAGTQKAGRRALGALASAGPGAGEGGARRRCHARARGAGAGALDARGAVAG